MYFLSDNSAERKQQQQYRPPQTRSVSLCSFAFLSPLYSNNSKGIINPESVVCGRSAVSTEIYCFHSNTVAPNCIVPGTDSFRSLSVSRIMYLEHKGSFNIVTIVSLICASLLVLNSLLNTLVFPPSEISFHRRCLCCNTIAVFEDSYCSVY